MSCTGLCCMWWRVRGRKFGFMKFHTAHVCRLLSVHLLVVSPALRAARLLWCWPAGMLAARV